MQPSTLTWRQMSAQAVCAFWVGNPGRRRPAAQPGDYGVYPWTADHMASFVAAASSVKAARIVRPSLVTHWSFPFLVLAGAPPSPPSPRPPRHTHSPRSGVHVQALMQHGRADTQSPKRCQGEGGAACGPSRGRCCKASLTDVEAGGAALPGELHAGTAEYLAGIL